jgi:hypothetical protein
MAASAALAQPRSKRAAELPWTREVTPGPVIVRGWNNRPSFLFPCPRGAIMRATERRLKSRRTAGLELHLHAKNKFCGHGDRAVRG